MAHDPERRRHERRQLSVDVSAWTLVQPTQLLGGRTVDLGIGGASLRLPGLAPGAVRLELRFALPDRPLVVQAAVVHRRPPDLVGVVFDLLDPTVVERLSGFVEGGT